ncbi:MAG TPA: hypothetical protein VMV33_17585 [Rhodocyclaceae bacterium]|nr:hypothetical protein [Rhodocyclaceae bacterium]
MVSQRKTLHRKLIVLALVAAVTLYFVLDPGRFLSLGALKTSQAALPGWGTAHRALAVAIFFSSYVALAMRYRLAALLGEDRVEVFLVDGGALLKGHGERGEQTIFICWRPVRNGRWSPGAAGRRRAAGPGAGRTGSIGAS